MREYNWYAIYTKSRCEKRLNDTLIEKGVQTFLPLVKVLKQRSDRKKWVQEPLFKSYLFVFITLKQFDLVRYNAGFVKFVSFAGMPSMIPKQDIELVKMLIQEKAIVEVVNDYYDIGEDVIITGGLLEGRKALVVDYKGRNKVLLELKEMQISIVVEVPVVLLQRC